MQIISHPGRVKSNTIECHLFHLKYPSGRHFPSQKMVNSPQPHAPQTCLILLEVVHSVLEQLTQLPSTSAELQLSRPSVPAVPNGAPGPFCQRPPGRWARHGGDHRLELCRDNPPDPFQDEAPNGWRWETDWCGKYQGYKKIHGKGALF